MYMHSLFAILVTVNVASASFSTALFSRRELAGRQSSSPLSASQVPSQCTSACTPTFSDAERCGTTDLSCLCTSSVRNNLVTCADCIIGVYPSLLDSLQSTADQSIAQCSQAGLPVDPVKLSGTSPGNGKNDAGALKSPSLAFAAAVGVGAAFVPGILV